MRVIRIKAGPTPEEINAAAEELLAGGHDTGDSEVLARAVWLAHEHQMDVQFRLPNGNIVGPALALRLIYERHLNIRTPSEQG